MWALEKLVFRKESFDGAATLLRWLAASETEGKISNNATGQFKQLYQLYLSGTEVPPAPRLLVLDEGLRSKNQKEREVCIEALNEMLDTYHFSRSGGAEEIGSSERLKDWEPKTHDEIRDFLRAAIKRLTDLAISSDPLAVRAKQILGAHIRGLISVLPLEEVKAMISSIVSHHGFWTEAVQEINEWLYFDRKKSPKKLGQAVRTYFDDLMPSDPVDLVVLYTHGWQTDFNDPDIDYDQEEKSQLDFEYAARQTIELTKVIAADSTATDRALDRLITSSAKTVFPFARRLAELAPNPTTLFEAALAKAEQRENEANRQFFGGLIAGIDSRDPKAARDCIRFALRSEKLKKDAISMIGSGKLQSSDIQLVISLLQSRDVEPWQCTLLANGRAMEHLPIEDIVPLLEELALHGAKGLWAALDIIFMILHGGKEPLMPLIGVLKNVLVDPALFKNFRGNMDGHHLEVMVKLLARHNLIDLKFARALVKQLLSICTQGKADVFHSFDDSVRVSLKALIDRHPQEVWTGVARLLQRNDRMVRHRLENLIASSHDDYLGPGLLYALPADFYLEWVRKDPPRRASILVDWLPIVSKAEGGMLSWHVALQGFIAEFGNQDHVLEAISMRLHPRTWWGSLVPYLEQHLKLLNSWLSHTRPEVRKWARHKVNNIRAQIQDEQRRDDEDVVRYS